MAKGAIVFSLLVIAISGCGGGGGGGSCPDDTPLECASTNTCCTRGHPYACDGYCYTVPQNGCAATDTCVFKSIETTADTRELSKLINPLPELSKTMMSEESE